MAISLTRFVLLGPALSGQLHREGDVVEDGHVRVEGIALEHHRDVPVLRREVDDVFAADCQGPAADLLEPRDHPERRRLSAARRADENQELAVGDCQRKILDHLMIPIGLANLVQHNLGH